MDCSTVHPNPHSCTMLRHASASSSHGRAIIKVHPVPGSDERATRVRRPKKGSQIIFMDRWKENTRARPN